MSRSDEAAVIFDMDGVLIDSYQAHFQSWQALSVDIGRAMTEEEFARTFGRTSREAIRQVWPEKGFTDEQIAALDGKKEETFRKIIGDDFPAMPGARELILALDERGFRVAIGSSGPPENVEMIIDLLGVRSRIRVVVTGADVHRGKPDPQVFQLAADRFGVAAGRCVVVEDAPDGIKAARAAGMAVVALVSTGRDRRLLSEADLIVDSLEELSPERFRDLLAEDNET